MYGYWSVFLQIYSMLSLFAHLLIFSISVCGFKMIMILENYFINCTYYEK